MSVIPLLIQFIGENTHSHGYLVCPTDTNKLDIDLVCTSYLNERRFAFQSGGVRSEPYAILPPGQDVVLRLLGPTEE